MGRLQLSGADCSATPDAVSRRRSHLWPNRGRLSQGTERSSTGDVRRWHRSLEDGEATVGCGAGRVGGGGERGVWVGEERGGTRCVGSRGSSLSLASSCRRSVLQCCCVRV